MSSVYVVTHAEATHHVDHLVGGWFDSELTDRGRSDAQKVAQRLRDLIPSEATTSLYTSDLARAVQTARPIAEVLGREAILLPDLRERSYGVAHGRPQAWLDERRILPPAVGERLDHDEGIEGGETRRAWMTRAYRAVEHIEGDPASHRIIVTHGGTQNWVIAAWLRLPIEACAYSWFRAGAGSITVLTEDEHRSHSRTLHTLGDVSHLR